MGKLFKNLTDNVYHIFTKSEHRIRFFYFKTSFYRDMKIANNVFWIRFVNHILYTPFKNNLNKIKNKVLVLNI